MKRANLILSSGLALALLVASCGEKEIPEGKGNTLSELPPAPSAEVVEALKGQAFGKKLLGKTTYLVGEEYVRADIQKAPKYYLINFSASF